MGRGKQQQRKWRRKVVLICIGLLGVALIADLLWASSSSSTSLLLFPYKSSFNTNYSATKEVISNHNNNNKDKKDGVHGRILSKTFADLAGPQLQWQKMADSPVPRLDGAAIQINDQLFVFAGYGTIDLVHSHVDVYNFSSNTWGPSFDMPKQMAHSHLGMVTDGRFIYIVTGQYGPQCRGPTARTFVLDTLTKKWQDMPPLPLPRYAPATQLWRGRLHVMGGSKEDRYTPALDHWSIAVKDGTVLDKEWRTEIPIPRGGPHRSCIVVDDRLYVIGGQEGDFMAKPNSPIFKCSRRNEVVYSDVYMLDDEMKWKVLPPMPKPDSHIEFAWVVVNNSIKHPDTKKMILVGEVFQFQLDTLKWAVVGKLPYRVKTTLVGFWDGWLYFTSGQRDRGPDDPTPKKVIGEMWRTKLSLPLS
ncbi:hypothetical protein M8C21_017106 [Ambrosia artemisiifolia]|uniref:Kelch repeat-containing protein n=1 Tax=Ambrosia artemisiifolia TaxID=4212 RepID=A0AAD5GBD5_AMBAR|nr:hypothetical protein M8C21_017106 [Ambrosia artemisiifolia]